VGLHNLAQAEGITVVALAQKNRESNKSNDKGMHSIAGSGQFESDADLIFNLVRAEERNGQDRWQTTLHISKNKKGRVDDIDMWFDGTTQKFTEMTDFEISERNRPVSVYHDVLKK
jgi:replicative DNA helicase